MTETRIRLPLPRKVRTRLWLRRRIDGAAIWLAEHQHFRAAENLWRACGMWK